MSPLVLHVLPLDVARGAQRYARALRDLLDGRGARHRTLTIFESGERALGADVELGVRRSWSGRRGFEWRASVALGKALRRLSPAVVVAHGSEPLKYLAPLPLRAPVVYYKIGIAAAPARTGARRALHSLMLRRAASVAGVSQECLDEARVLFGVPEPKLVLIPNGRDPVEFHPSEAPPEPGRVPVVTFLGRLTDTKRPDLFVRLVRRLRQSGLSFEAQIAGDGPLRAELAAPAAEAGVRLLGPRSDAADLLRATDVFVFTSVAEGEGMPGVLIEAGLSGVPVVTTDVPGARAVVLSGDTGYVASVDDEGGLETAAGELLRDPVLRARMGARGRAHCLQEFTLGRSAERWESLLRRMM